MVIMDDKPVMIFIIATARSGTHAVRSILEQESWVYSFNEIFNPTLQHKLKGAFSPFLKKMIKLAPEWAMNAENGEAILNDYFSYLQAISDGRIPLIDIKDSQIRIMDWPDSAIMQPPYLLRHILKAGHPIIRITRRNWLAQHTSMKLAIQTGCWVTRDKKSRKIPSAITLEKHELLWNLNNYKTSEAVMQEWLANHPRTAMLCYEDLFAPEGHFNHACQQAIEQALGQSLTPSLTPLTQKLAPPLSDTIANLAEVGSWLSDTPYAHLLEGDQENSNAL